MQSVQEWNDDILVFSLKTTKSLTFSEDNLREIQVTLRHHDVVVRRKEGARGLDFIIDGALWEKWF